MMDSVQNSLADAKKDIQKIKNLNNEEAQEEAQKREGGREIFATAWDHRRGRCD